MLKTETLSLIVCHLVKNIDQGLGNYIYFNVVIVSLVSNETTERSLGHHGMLYMTPCNIKEKRIRKAHFSTKTKTNTAFESSKFVFFL